MMLFYIPSTKHLADTISMPKGTATFSQFTDGEWHVHIHENVKGKAVWVLAQTGAPADTLVQLLLLCDALKRAGATFNIMLSYMGYARQDREFEGQAVSALIMRNLIESCQPKKVHVLQLHNPAICSELFVNHIPYPFFNECASDPDVIVAPDKGAASWAGHISNTQFKQLIYIEKKRPAPETVVMHIAGDVVGKHALIVDDMITTGNTIIQATELLFEHGARTVRVAATHGLFTENAHEKLEKSKIEKIYVTNSLLQKKAKKVTVVDVAPFIEGITREE